MRPIFIKKNCVITTNIVPWIMGVGAKTPEQAKEYIKRGDTLNPEYYPSWQKAIELKGQDAVFNEYLQTIIYDKEKIHEKISKLIGENVYIQTDCATGLFCEEINEEMGLGARVYGVTKNLECIIWTDDRIVKFDDNLMKEIEIKMIASMAVWTASKAIYFFPNMKWKKVIVNFNENKWKIILNQIKEWAKTI